MAKSKTTFQPAVRSVFVVAFLVTLIWTASVWVGQRRQSVLGEATTEMAAPVNLKISYFCKNNWPWATLHWDGVEGANAYRVKFWKTTGEFLHAEITESASRTTEMYKEFDTQISVQALRRESQGEELKVVADSGDSGKLLVRAADIRNKCNGETGSSEVTDKTEPTKKPVEPTAKPEPAETKKATEVQKEASPAAKDATAVDLVRETDQIEKKNQAAENKQSFLEEVIQSLLTSFKNLFR